MSISKLNISPVKAFAVIDPRFDKPKGALYVVQPHAALAIFGERPHAEEFVRTKADLRAEIREIEFSLTRQVDLS